MIVRSFSGEWTADIFNYDQFTSDGVTIHHIGKRQGKETTMKVINNAGLVAMAVWLIIKGLAELFS